MLAIFILSFLTLLVLVAGLVLMATGGKLNTKFSNRLMTLRVGFQAATIVTLIVIYYFSKQ